jgi:AraC-like DNA-binding protein
MHLIKRSGNNISEVAEIMGYADPTSFRRAFKTWTQATPKSVKRQAVAV